MASSPDAPSHLPDVPDALQEVLTNFVRDSMYDRPHDIVEYMKTWAHKQLLQKQDGGGALASPDRRTSRLSITPTSVSAMMQAAVFSETADEAGGSAGEEAADRLRHLTENRQKLYRDIAQGCLDNYLLSLEDSDGDIFYVDALRHKMESARLQEVSARGDTAAIEAHLKEIQKSERTATQKAREQAMLLYEYEQRWAHEKLNICHT
ncbi:hypothetical protein, unknown function [Leishmania tarentolae]|uniref:Uncharacterized protein n=1 Tax=Leishmania tarentolae TaxID=5689 RepID=A0A640KJ69_LEITA|nr:hypothetical protein, unknown function [Leishmania tarentolae]